MCSQVLIHGRHARILARMFGIRSEDRGGDAGEGRTRVLAAEWGGILFYHCTIRVLKSSELIVP